MTFDLTDVFTVFYLIKLIEETAKAHGVEEAVRSLSLEVDFEWLEHKGDFEALRAALEAKQVLFGYRALRHPRFRHPRPPAGPPRPSRGVGRALARRQLRGGNRSMKSAKTRNGHSLRQARR